jgi:hypothetical protein
MGDLFKACDAGSVAVSKAPKFDLIALDQILYHFDRVFSHWSQATLN